MKSSYHWTWRSKENSAFKSKWHIILWLNCSQLMWVNISCSLNKLTNMKHEAVYFIMLFILTTGYTDQVYKSVSSKRKLTHPSVGHWVCVLLFMCVSFAETLGVHCCFYQHQLPPPLPHQSSCSDQQDTPSSQCTVQGEDIFIFICLFLLSGALWVKQRQWQFRDFTFPN